MLRWFKLIQIGRYLDQYTSQTSSLADMFWDQNLLMDLAKIF